jgi:amino acid adenylation domain-containing protein
MAQRQRAPQDLEEDLAYWRRQIGDAPDHLDLPLDRPRLPVPSFHGASLPLELPTELVEAVAVLAHQEGTDLLTVLTGAFQAVLLRYTGQTDILVGTRIGLVLRGDLSGDPSFRTLIRRLRSTVQEAVKHRTVPFDRVLQELRPNHDPGSNPLCRVFFTLRTTEISETPLPYSPDLSLDLRERNGEVDGALEFNAELFDRPTAERFLAHFTALLMGAVESPDRLLSDLPLLPLMESQLLAEWSSSAREIPLGSGFIALFRQQTARTPEAIAVVCGGDHLTYAELDRRTDELAWHLAGLGTGDEGIVAVLAERGLDLLTAMMALFKAGLVYLPLDPRHPASRQAQVLRESRARFVLAAAELVPVAEQAVASLSGARPRLLAFADLAAPVSPRPLVTHEPRRLAYSIFTSGSTGVPKGAMVEHRGMLNHLFAKIIDLALRADDVVAQTASQCFDISVWQFLAALLVGARVEIFPNEIAHDPARLLRETGSRGVTILETVPSLLRAMVEEAARGRAAGGALRWMIPTGEVLPPDLCNRWLELFPHIPLVNAYGPTECSDDVTHRVLRTPLPGHVANVPIGRPVINMRLHVVSHSFQAQAVGIAGELCVAGVGVGRGYLNDPLRTAAVFVPDPFAAEPGAVMYRTGDLARWLPSGELEFLGRIDHQVKVRGFRLELGEIESVLASHPDMRECVVMAREDTPGEQRLVAYCVLRPEAVLDRGALRAFLVRSLPDYMIPAAFVTLPGLPLSPNGKIDRKALPVPQRERPDLSGELVPPRTVTESALVTIWSAALDLDELGVRDDFFALGGHSLLALRVVTAIRERFSVELPLAVLFRAPTVERMAALLDGTAVAPSSHLVLMAGAGAPGAPLFCVHGIGGHVFRLVYLAQQLRAERPFYGIQGWSDLNDISHMASVEVMAERYLAAIRQVQPTGPYRLAGYSLGGVVAYEMARRLTAMGESVAWLGMLDASVPRPPEPLPPGKIISFEAGLAEELGFAVDIEHIRQLAPEQRLGYVVGEGIRVGVLPQGFTVADGQRYIHVFYANFAAFQSYAPQPWEGRLAVFRTAAEAATSPDPTLGWGILAAGGVDLFEVPGDHITLVRPPNVELLAQNISLSLTRIEAPAPEPAVSVRSEENPMNAESLLFPRTDELLLPGDFRTIGAPALLVTNESTPAGFHDHLRETVAPDGWIYGPGCGNVLSLVEAFAGTPRGMVLVDVDPAVVLAGRMLVAALRRYPDAASFTSGFFCGGREPLAALEEEVLEREPSALLRAAMNGQRERLWRTLATLTESFSLQSGDADRLLAQWASHYPPAGHLVPVRTFLARNYGRLREMALRGDIAVLCSSLFHPALLVAVTELPGWRGGRNVIYLSNVTDHVLRRTLMANARARLRVVVEEPQRTLRSTAEFVTVLNAEQVGALREVDTPGTVYVASSAKNGLTLTAATELPVFREDDFGIDFNLDRNVVHFFEAFAGPASAEGALPVPWSEGRPLRALILRLYSAAVRGDEAAAGTLLRQLASWLDHQPREADPLWTAFWLAEIGHGLLILRRTPIAAALVPETAVLHQPIEAAAAALLSRLEDLRTSTAELPLPALLGSVGLTFAGELLGDERLISQGISLGDAVRTSDGRFTLPGAPAAAAQAEALLRLTVWQIHRPLDGLGVALTRVAAALLPAIRGNGDVSRDGVEGQGDGYSAYLAEPEVLFETVKLALLFYGLSAEEGIAIEAALQVDYHARHRQIAETPDTDVLLGASR